MNDVPLSASKFLVVLFLFCGFAIPTHANAQTWQLSSKPEKCVSLNQGMICYKNVELQWSTDVIGNYCLFQAGNKKPLECWQQALKGKIEIAFAEKKNMHYILRRSSTQQDLATTTVVVKWVHKSRKHSNFRWRVF